MHSSTIIAEIHERLQKTLPHNLVLLGGSYLYGDANEESDLDFYVICRWRDILTASRLRTLVAEIRDKQFMVPFSATLVPRYFFRQGWYYVYGRDIKGEIHRSAIYPALIIRNSLKLAYYHYLRAIVSADLKTRQARLIKAAQQLAAALIFDKKVYSLEPFFSLQNLLKQLGHFDYNKYGILITLLQSKLDREEFSNHAIRIAERVLWKVQELAYYELRRHVDAFLLPNYLIYNGRFLPKGIFLFLIRNPDKMIIEYLRRRILKHENLAELERLVKRIVFPVIII